MKFAPTVVLKNFKSGADICMLLRSAESTLHIPYTDNLQNTIVESTLQPN